MNVVNPVKSSLRAQLFYRFNLYVAYIRTSMILSSAGIAQTRIVCTDKHIGSSLNKMR